MRRRTASLLGGTAATRVRHAGLAAAAPRVTRAALYEGRRMIEFEKRRTLLKGDRTTAEAGLQRPRFGGRGSKELAGRARESAVGRSTVIA